MSMAAGISYYQQYCRVMTSFINETEIRIICDQAAQLSDLQPILAHSKQKYHSNLLQETPTFILELVRKVNDREGKKQLSERARGTPLQFWAFGERKIFCWVLVFYSHLYGEQSHLLALQAIFHQKSLGFLEYEVTSIARSKSKTKEPWMDQEILLLTRIVEQTKDKQDWRAISFKLFVESKGATFKALQECREKWCNYLNPQLNKESWSLEEDYQLFDLIEREGCRWARISRRLRLKRTEHMVKNRYNAYLRSWKNKRSNVKTKKGLTGRILAYLRARIHKKLKREELLLQAERSESLQLSNPEEHNQYSSNQMPSSEEEEPILQIKVEASGARQAYLVEKKEKNTADCEDPLPLNSPLAASVQEDSRSFNFQLMVNSFGGMQFKSGKEEMKLIEDEVVRALGCSHFQRALEPYQYDVFEDCDSLSWLI